MDRTVDVYVARVNRAIDVVLADVAGDLRLERLAAEAGFSSFHFHRIFKSMVGETLADFVARVRLKRAVRMMTHHAVPLTDVALADGFSSLSSFSRAFRNRYGVPPSAFDPKKHAEATRAHRICPPRPNLAESELFTVKVRTQRARTVLYRRVTSSYGPGRLLAATAELVDLVDRSAVDDPRWLGYSWDDPDIVAVDRCRYDVAVEVPADTRAPAPFGIAAFPETLIAEIHIDGDIEVEQQALDWLFSIWLPSSGHFPADMPTFEAWDELPFPADDGTIKLSVQLPITTAS